MSDDRLRGAVGTRRWWAMCVSLVLIEVGTFLIALDLFLSGRTASGALYVLLMLGLAGGAGSLIYRSRPEQNGS